MLMMISEIAGDTGMRIKNRFFTSDLSDRAAERISEVLADFLHGAGTDGKTADTIRLFIGSILAQCRGFFGEAQKISVFFGKRLFSPCIRLEIVGAAFDPTDDMTGGEGNSRLLSRMGFRPSYQYTRGRNVITVLPPKKKLNPMLRLLAMAMLAVVAGLFGVRIPAGVKRAVCDLFLEPVSTVFFGLISMLAIPMIFLAVFLAVCGMGDMETFGRIGKRTLGRMALTTALCMVIALPVLLAAMGIVPAVGTGGSYGLDGIAELIFGIFPDNLFSPFLEGDSLQLILIASGFGVAMLLLGSGKSEPAVRVADTLQSALGVLMGWVTSAMPFLIFAVILSNIWSGTVSEILNAWMPFVLTLLLSVLLFFARIVVSAIRMKTGVRVLLSKVMPAMLIAFSTASSSAAFPEMRRACEEKCGVSRSLTGVSIPLGMVIDAPCMGILFLACSLYGAAETDIPVSPAWLITLLVSAYFLAVAAPPAAGGGVSCLSVLFTQLGIPGQMLAVSAAIYVVADFYMTSVQVGFMQLDTVWLAYRNDWLDRNALRQG